MHEKHQEKYEDKKDERLIKSNILRNPHPKKKGP